MEPPGPVPVTAPGVFVALVAGLPVAAPEEPTVLVGLVFPEPEEVGVAAPQEASMMLATARTDTTKNKERLIFLSLL